MVPRKCSAAADELASYAGRVVGTKLDVIPFGKLAADAPGLSFFVGDDVAERVLGQSPKPWKTEEWMLRTVPNGLVLAGHDGDADPWSIGTAAGSMLAVYTLLEDHLGVRWFWPGSSVSMCRRARTRRCRCSRNDGSRPLRFDRFNWAIPAPITQKRLPKLRESGCDELGSVG